MKNLHPDRLAASRNLFLLTLTLMLAGSGEAAVITVHPDGSGEAATIADALAVAVDGDVVELADGIYTGPGNRDLDPAGVLVTVRSVNGDPAACVIDCGGAPDADHRAFRFHSAETEAFRVEGLTLTGGHAAPGGGAVSCTGGSSPRFLNCVFLDNTASETGGAVYCSGGSRPVFIDCVFRGNRGAFYGGAVRAISASPSFTRCHFELNQCHNGGALSYYRDGTPEIIDCTFVQNDATRGAAIFIYASEALVVGCTFTDNSCLAEGGGIDSVETELTVRDCVFTGNHAGETGGGVSSGGVGWLRADGCLFVGNSSLRGGAVHGQYTALELSACTLVGNRGDLLGSGLTIFFSTAVLERVIIVDGEVTPAVHCEEAGFVPDVTCSDIVGHAAGDWTGCLAELLGTDGNISADPLFCDPAAGDYGLQADSPATAACGIMGSEVVECGVTGTPRPVVDSAFLTAYPNPGSDGTTLAWRLPRDGHVTVEVFDLAGRRLWRQTAGAGHGDGSLRWPGHDLAGRKVAAGIYLARLSLDGGVIARQPVVVAR